MSRISSKLVVVAGLCAVFAALSVAALMLIGGLGGSSPGTPPASAIETPAGDGSGDAGSAAPQTSAPASGLPPCPSATATNCDRTRLEQSVGTHGSAACTGKGTATIGASPIDLNEIAYIQPMGLMIGGHVTPIDHGYFYIKGAMETPPRQAAVKAPLAGIITSVTRTVRQGGVNGDYDDYALTIEATCTFRVRFSNLVKLAGRLGEDLGQLEPNQNATPNYKVAEGELIGYTGLPTAYGIDVWVENDDITLSGFVNTDQYATSESWKLHMADLFDNTSEPLKSELLALDMRDGSPRWGKIDYDVDGRLVGNWFRQGSGGYAGVQKGSEGYWDGHLSVVYDGNDPGQIDISFGNYRGQPQQFAVIGNAPDPADVTEATGVVAYQLGQIVTYSGDTGEAWDHRTYLPHVRTRADSTVMGTVLMQLTGRRQMKLEIFPGKTAAQVQGFDSGALVYER